jgi:hypothetical protein
VTDLESAEITLATLRDWAERSEDAENVATMNAHARGVRYAARCVQAILDSRRLPPGQPVHFPDSFD